MKQVKKLIVVIGAFIIALSSLLISACSGKERITIWTAWTEEQSGFYMPKLRERFPDYNIVHEYLNTGTIAAKILAERERCAADIVYSEEYNYLEQCSDYFIELSDFDYSPYLPELVPQSHKYVPELKNSGCIIINPKALADAGLDEPNSYNDLLDSKYRRAISMPNPRSSGTGYMFLKQLVNEWGEDEAFGYFNELSKNILSFTASGSGPVNALIQGEVAIGFGMTAQAVTEINDGIDLKIKFFENGAPFSMCGGGILRKGEVRDSVKEVFNYLACTLTPQHNSCIFPEQIYKDVIPVVENYPTNIHYGNMSNDTLAEKERLLEKWTLA